MVTVHVSREPTQWHLNIIYIHCTFIFNNTICPFALDQPPRNKTSVCVFFLTLFPPKALTALLSAPRWPESVGLGEAQQSACRMNTAGCQNAASPKTNKTNHRF